MVASINAIVSGVGSDVDSVYLQVYPDNIVGTAFKNNQFQINLLTLSSKYLYSLDFEDGITVSDASAKVTFNTYLAAYKEGEEVGTFYYIKTNLGDGLKLGDAEGEYVYADKDVKITYTARWNVSLKAGWNIVAAVVKELSDTKEVYEYTTSFPGGFKWVYIPETNKSNQMSAMFRKMVK